MVFSHKCCYYFLFFSIITIVCSVFFYTFFNFSPTSNKFSFKCFNKTQVYDLKETFNLSEVDYHLKKIAKECIESDYVPNGNKMHSAEELTALFCPTLISPPQPCGRNNGKDLLGVFFVFSVVKEFERRNTIRNTYGGALKEHPQTQLYFVIAKFNEFK